MKRGLDFAGVCRRVGEVRETAASDPARARLLEDQLHQDVLDAIAERAVGDPAAFAIAALATRQIEFDREASCAAPQ